VAAIPVDRVATIGVELARRGAWVIIAGFVDQVGRPALHASLAVFDGEQLLRIGFVLDDPDRLDDIAAALTDGKLDELLAAAATHGLWRELGALVGHLSADRWQHLAERYAAAPDTVRASFERAVADGDLAPTVLDRVRAA
jgi:hypothetical protein